MVFLPLKNENGIWDGGGLYVVFHLVDFTKRKKLKNIDFILLRHAVRTRIFSCLYYILR